MRRDAFFSSLASSPFSRVFPSEEEEDRGLDGDDDGQDGVSLEGSVEGRQGHGGIRREASWKPSERKAASAAKAAKPKASAGAAAGGKLEHRNLMFHAANVNAESAVAR